MAHCNTVHLPLGALLSPCTMCGTGNGPDGAGLRVALRQQCDSQADCLNLLSRDALVNGGGHTASIFASPATHHVTHPPAAQRQRMTLSNAEVHDRTAAHGALSPTPRTSH